MKIHEAYRVAEIAHRYYQKKNPKKYSKEQARKQLWQEANLDKKVIKEVIDGIYDEQMQLLKNEPAAA